MSAELKNKTLNTLGLIIQSSVLIPHHYIFIAQSSSLIPQSSSRDVDSLWGSGDATQELREV